MTYSTLDQFIADLPRVAAEVQDRLKGQNGRFRLTTRQGRSFNICLKDGLVTLPETLTDPADCTVTADERTLLELLNGRLNPAAALLFGRVSVKGDMGKLMALAKLVG